MLLVSCTEAAVQLRYRFDTGNPAAYRWTVEASTDLDSPGLAESKVLLLTLDVEEIPTGPAGKAEEGTRLRLVLRPTSLVEDGVEISPGLPVSMTIDVSPTGGILAIQETHIPPPAVASFELERLVTEFRPVLPTKAVAIGDRWLADLEVGGQSSGVSLRGRGVLEGFSLRSGRRVARLRIDRKGAVLTNQTVGRAQVSLPGEVESSATAEIDLDSGTLFSQRSRSESVFSLSGAGTGLRGTLRVVIRTEVQAL